MADSKFADMMTESDASGGVNGKGNKRLRTQTAQKPIDRAMNGRCTGLVRIKLDQLGFHPDNRAGLGCSPFHTHEVGSDVANNGVNLDRYQHVPIIMIPESELKRVRMTNKLKGDSDELMPQFAAGMTYATLGKTHFVHALKLLSDGGRTHMNDGTSKLAPKSNDSEYKAILHMGVLCQMFEPGLWYDTVALDHMMAQDNFNQNVQMQQDEMFVYGTVGRLKDRLDRDVKKEQSRYKSLVRDVKDSFAVGWSDADIKFIVDLRLQLNVFCDALFKSMCFAVVAGRVRVSPKDFGLVARLHPEGPLAKVMMLLSLYVGALPSKKTTEGVTYVGRVELKAKRLREDVVKRLQYDGADLVMHCNNYGKKVLARYVSKDEDSDAAKMLQPRCTMLAEFGKALIAAGLTLDENMKKGIPSAKDLACSELMSNALPLVEHQFSQALVAAGVFDETTRPVAVLARRASAVLDGAATAKAKGKGRTHLGPKATTPAGVQPTSFDKNGNVVHSHALGDVMERLEIKKLPARVVVNAPPLRDAAGVLADEFGDAFKAEVKDDDDDDLSDEPRNLSRGVEDASLLGYSGDAILVSIDEKVATIRVRAGDGDDDDLHVTMKVLLRDLRAAEAVEEAKETYIHPLWRLPSEASQTLEFSVDGTYYPSSMLTQCSCGLHAALEMSIASITDTEVHVMSEQDKLPYMLQVRAKRAFKTGELVFVPFGKALSVANPEDVILPDKRRLGDPRTVIHEAHEIEAAAIMSIVFPAAPKKGPKKSKTSTMTAEEDTDKLPDDVSIIVQSPLSCGKAPKLRDECLRDLSPYWAVSKSVSLQGGNVIIQRTTLVISPPTHSASSSKMPTMAHKVSMDLMVMRNNQPIEAGELITLPMRVADDVAIHQFLPEP